MIEKTKHPSDPRGLIYESYRIAGISAPECRSVFLDWALGIAADDNFDMHVMAMITAYSHGAADHPMTLVLREALNGTKKPKRRGGRRRIEQNLST